MWRHSAYVTEWNLVGDEFLLPSFHDERPEVLVEGTRVRQEATREKDVTHKTVDLRLERLASFCPANTLSRKTIDER